MPPQQRKCGLSDTLIEFNRMDKPYAGRQEVNHGQFKMLARDPTFSRKAHEG